MVDVEFIDCSSVNVQYDATGKASVSFVVIKNSTDPINVHSYRSLCFGFVNFTGVLMNIVQRPIVGSYNEATGEMWVEWQMNLQGVGNRLDIAPSRWGKCGEVIEQPKGICPYD